MLILSRVKFYFNKSMTRLYLLTPPQVRYRPASNFLDALLVVHKLIQSDDLDDGGWIQSVWDNSTFPALRDSEDPNYINIPIQVNGNEITHSTD